MAMTNNRNRTSSRLHESLVNVIVHVINVRAYEINLNFLKSLKIKYDFTSPRRVWDAKIVYGFNRGQDLRN